MQTQLSLMLLICGTLLVLVARATVAQHVAADVLIKSVTHQVIAAIKTNCDARDPKEIARLVEERMACERKLVSVDTTGRRLPNWPQIGLTVAAAATSTIVLCLWFALALALLIAATVALLPVLAWRLWWANRWANRRPEVPAVLEGEYSVCTPIVPDNAEEAEVWYPPGDAGNWWWQNW
jgi:Flp pilus assembly protein TadB